MAHAHLGAEQGIRANEDHLENAKDALGDVFIYMCNYCNVNGIDSQEAIEKTWGKVKQRDWTKNKISGGE